MYPLGQSCRRRSPHLEGTTLKKVWKPQHYDSENRYCNVNIREVREFQIAFNLAKAADELENAYALRLRDILVRRLMKEEEYERWTMYARDKRFEASVAQSKWARANFNLHVALPYAHARERTLPPLLHSNEMMCRRHMRAKLDFESHDCQNNQHTLDKDKQQGNDKLPQFKMKYDVSKNYFLSQPWLVSMNS